MPQTLLALLALVLASFLTFNQQRLTMRSQTNMVTAELELAAAGLASEAMAFIEGRSFDENSTPEKIAAEGGAVPEEDSQFSSPGSFGYSGDCDYLQPAATPNCDDVDDLAGRGWTPVSIELARELIIDPDTGLPYPDSVRTRELDFEVRTDVYYVDTAESMTPASGRTRHKRVTMDIRTPHLPTSPDGIMRVTRVVSYDPVKAGMDYENWEGHDSGNTLEPGTGSTNEPGSTSP